MLNAFLKIPKMNWSSKMENLRIKMEIKNLMELIPHLGPSSDLFAEASTIGRLVFRLLGCCFLPQHV